MKSEGDYRERPWSAKCDNAKVLVEGWSEGGP